MNDKLKILYYYFKYRRNRFKTTGSLQKYQQKKITKQLDFVADHTRFYKACKGKKLHDYPIFDKQKMMSNFNEINTVGVDLDTAKAFAVESERSRKFSATLNGVTVGLSSGTSGNQGVFLVSDREKVQWAGYVLARFLPNGMFKRNVIAFFMRANSNLYEAVGSKNIKFLFLDIFLDLSRHIELLNQARPSIVVGQPSVLLQLAEAVNAGRLNISPERVVSIAEVLEENDSRMIKKAFNIPVVHQVYQCTEGCLGTTCAHGTLHLNEDIVYIEKEYLEDFRFVPIITDFTRRSQPVIRYRMNDILVEKRDQCPCGSPFSAIEKIEGREDDIFVFQKNGDEIRIYPDFIRRCILFIEGISDYRIVQRSYNLVEIYINADIEQRKAIEKEFEILAEEKQFEKPEVCFLDYHYSNKRKLKRVERAF